METEQLSLFEKGARQGVQPVGPIRVLLADDHTILREGLKQILAGCGDIVVAGEAGDGAETLAKVRQGGWHVLVLDLTMPGKSDIDLLRQVKSEKPQLPVLVLSMHREDEYAVRALRAGAAGYLCKDTAGPQLIEAIRKVARGGVYISAAAAEGLAADITRAHTGLPHTRLTDRELSIFKLIAVGEEMKVIADRLCLSPKTVSSHKTRILQKMGLGNAADLTRYAVENRLLDDTP